MKKELFILISLVLISGCNSNVIKRPEVYFCPAEDCKGALIENLNKAEKSIYFLSYSFTDNETADLLIEKSKEIEIKGVMEKQGTTSKYSQFSRLNKNSVEVRYDKNKQIMHSKVFIIDKKVVVTGSLNPSKNGYYENNENIVVIEDEEIAGEYVAEFKTLFN